MTDYYYIICLKRSKFVDSNHYEYHSDWWNDCYKVYWKPERCGYTNLIELAGHYTANDLSQVCGEGIDWMIIRVPRRDS
jgi:hypothetical protein